MKTKTPPKYRKTNMFLHLWKLRYRLYAIIVIMLLPALLFAGDANTKDSIPVDAGYKVVKSELLADQVRLLKQGQPVNIPMYDFVTHSRRKETILIRPKPVIIVDGILIFHSPRLRDQFNERIFFDTTEERRYQRRRLPGQGPR